MKYQPYPAYKESGVEWLGRVPNHWSIIPVYAVASLSNGFPFDSKRFSDTGVDSDRLIRIRDLLSDQQKTYTDEPCPEPAIISNGDLLIGMDGDFNTHLWNRGPAKLNQRVCVLRSNSRAITQYLQYSLAAPLQTINDLTYATTVKHLSAQQVLHTRIALPSLAELDYVVTHLNTETFRIDTLIAKKTRFIELLQEKRQALITRAVTRGLNPDAPMKDSGVEWIGEVPAHWSFVKIAHGFTQIGSGATPPSSEQSWYTDQGTPWVTTSELRENVITETVKHVTDEALQQFSALRIYPPGSLLIAMYGATIGRLAILGVNASTNQACCVLSGPKKFNTKFIFYWLFAKKEALVNFYAAGGGQPNINKDVISSLRLPAPSVEEQAAIAKRLDEHTARIDTLITKTQRSIELLQERRAALITAAVIGQIDLREAV